jgi:hypothetical protein
MYGGTHQRFCDKDNLGLFPWVRLFLMLGTSIHAHRYPWPCSSEGASTVLVALSILPILISRIYKG